MQPENSFQRNLFEDAFRSIYMTLKSKRRLKVWEVLALGLVSILIGRVGH